MGEKDINFLIQAQNKLENSVEKLARSVEALAEKNFQASQKTSESFENLIKEVTKLIERDKIQNRRLETIEKKVSTHDHIIKIGLGGGAVLVAVLRALGVDL